MKRTGKAVGKQAGTPARKKKSAVSPKAKPPGKPGSLDQSVGGLLKSPPKKKPAK
jgi:hypothetical protein